MDKPKNMEEINYERIVDISKVEKLEVKESAWKSGRNLNICGFWTMMDCLAEHCTLPWRLRQNLNQMNAELVRKLCSMNSS